MQTALEFIDVFAGYADRKVLRGVSLRLMRGERVALIGPNGAGKSTLVAVATGLLRASAGTVRLFGEDVAALPDVRRARLAAVVPQDMDASAPFTVEEIAMMGRHASIGRWAPCGDEDRAAVREALEYTATAKLAKRQFAELSGGERQRVCIAMALASGAPLLLMDEPTSHLDLRHHATVARIVEELNRDRGLTVLLVAHDLNFAAEYFDRVVALSDGKIRADGRPDDVLTTELMREVYGCETTIHRDPHSNSLRIFPRHRV